MRQSTTSVYFYKNKKRTLVVYLAPKVEFLFLLFYCLNMLLIYSNNYYMTIIYTNFKKNNTKLLINITYYKLLILFSWNFLIISNRQPKEHHEAIFVWHCVFNIRCTRNIPEMKLTDFSVLHLSDSFTRCIVLYFDYWMLYNIHILHY